jgi:hypothetical protein
MTIIMADGRGLQGTAVQNVDTMRPIAFLPSGTSLPDYSRTTVAQARSFMAVELNVPEGDEEFMAAALVRAMVKAGLATRV